MIPKTLMLRSATLNAGVHRLCSRRCYSTEVPSKNEPFDISSAEETPRYIQTLTEADKEELMQKRLKSNLNDSHRRIIQGERPYDENMAWFHATIRYKRRMLGRYGMAAMDGQIGAAWPTEEEIQDKILWERTAYPKSIQERWKEIEDKKIEEEKGIRLREETITKNMAMVGKWQNELKAKLAKKEADVVAAKERKARLVEEVRRQFGFAIDPRDERFKQLLEQKEKEDKKRKKEAKKKERAAKFLASMMGQTKGDSGEASPSAETKDSEEPVQKKPEKET
ncbi:growth arrest and DNA damage-inducible proteins-interacting protein 1 [Diachasma alloeum]|uniref:growth arrest and DNA damage-inducible proteins-interacting protein 1 n=1 Tax=Diachasma alloeum TaxID=454923 RepID=UPI00073813D9|nr:growth arrest and DNA damage-inducible proteins-interacting protein 1 [Diachasma alloeum]